MISVQIPDNFAPERAYIVDTLLSKFLGLDYKLTRRNDVLNYEIILENGRSLVFRDQFFLNLDDKPGGMAGYLDVRMIPTKTVFLKNKFTPLRDIPVIFGSEEMHIGRDSIICGIDIFASAFFMLTRWEEYVNKKRDIHDRFPAHESLAYKQDFLHRVVVNEYVEMLWSMLSYLKCAQGRKIKKFKTFATHDVDAPFLRAMKTPFIAIKQFGGDLIKRKDLNALKNFNSWLKTSYGHTEIDPYNTFDCIMDIDEKFGLQGSFFFMTDCKQPQFDGDYNIRHKLVRKLMARIHRRGHDIGLHSSYGSFDDQRQIKRELDILKAVCLEEGVDQKLWMNRQHFLRWDTPATSTNLDNAGMDYDLTLSYADISGFRCGVCNEFPLFDILARKTLHLRERPLLVMECTVIDDRYMGLGSGFKACSYIKTVKDTCRRFNGDFVVLWHNTRFIDPRERQLYSLIMEA